MGSLRRRKGFQEGEKGPSFIETPDHQLAYVRAENSEIRPRWRQFMRNNSFICAGSHFSRPAVGSRGHLVHASVG